MSEYELKFCEKCIAMKNHGCLRCCVEPKDKELAELREKVKKLQSVIGELRPELVYQIDNDFAGLQSRNFQDGVYWARKMMQEKFDKLLESSPSNAGDEGLEHIENSIKAAIVYLEDRGIRESGTIGRTQVLPGLDNALAEIKRMRGVN